jgi:hypothetical protein
MGEFNNFLPITSIKVSATMALNMVTSNALMMR